MYELFLTALVEDRDIAAANAVLGGYCSMQPWESLHRVLYFQGPPRPTGITNQTSIEKPMRKNAVFLWKELHQTLARQSFILQVRYEVLRHVDFGPDAPPMDLDAAPGILRWTDFPDPPRGQPLTQRKKVELWEQRKLLSILQDNNHQLKMQTIEESFCFFRDDIEFCLSRQYLVAPVHHLNQQSPRLHPLPPWENLTRLDMQDRWILHIKAHVLQDNKPDEIRKAQEQLLAVRADLEGVFDFRNVDRKVHDTRVAMQPQGVQALPHKVLLGK